MYKVLAIDDDEQFLKSLTGLLQYKNYEITAISNPTIAVDLVRRREFDCILLDVKMPGIDGLTLLEQFSTLTPRIPVVMISGQSTLSIAVDAIKKGAFDFLEKGADLDRLLITLQNAIAKRNWVLERDRLLNELYDQFQMVGQSPAIHSVFSQIEMVAPTDAKVLITGETGTGKELVARAIHFKSDRSSKPYIKVNCAAIPETLIESTFFGHKKGSFTGAVKDQDGKFEQADGGTIFLDEIGELPMAAQAKLLRVLQDGEIEKIGAQTPRHVDVRIIAATNKNLEERIHKGLFRADLYHRLKVMTIYIPPLRERVDDIPLLARHFLKKFSDKYNKTLTDFSSRALTVLMQQEWPGNVRMLENVIEKTAIFARGPIINANEVIQALRSGEHDQDQLADRMPLKEFLEYHEKKYLRRLLLISNGKKQKAAEIARVDRATLWRKMQKYGLSFIED
ncbi:MAG TPA: sigma-54-dependent Fis family transcriptional regulator [Caldithrix abyssi]|uniref:Sigma-54-dependent Fis family transcriptional regulator n=1 Tax=Caldithrix abyssi TaxID=187145 RepID=A0A7V5PMR5_CALAY|nr:sigma-54-dependent Fis family transcriptional regulator [Caldithrix abyssi]